MSIVIRNRQHHKKQLVAARLKIIQGTGDKEIPSIQLIDDALKDRPRPGDATKRKIGSNEDHSKFVIDLLEKEDARLSELCTLFEARSGIRVGLVRSTMRRFVNRELGFTRQRVQKQLPKQALTEKNKTLRRGFVENV